MTMGPGEFIEKIICNDIEAVRGALSEAPSLAAARDTYLGSTPLHFAAHRGFGEVVAALLEAGADLHAREAASDTTPLHWAAEGGHPAIGRMLVERGADLEALDSWHRLSPLGWATVVMWAPPFHEDKVAMAAYLLEAGARLDVFTAIVTGKSDAVRSMAVTHAEVLSRRLGFMDAEMEPLHFAVARRLPEMVRLLLDLGADVESRTAWGLTPLALALKNKDTASAALLRARGANEDLSTAVINGDLLAMAAHLKIISPGLPTGDPRSALLFFAAQEGMAEAIELLSRYGLDANARAKHLIGEVPSMVTPLHLAAMNGHDAAVRALLEAGAVPDAGWEEGTPTPLHVAAGGGRMQTVRVLLDRGANVTAREKGFGATPIGWAEHEGHAEIAELLRERQTTASAHEEIDPPLRSS